jgi:uncharacterized membrane protein (DUF4010 family)
MQPLPLAEWMPPDMLTRLLVALSIGLLIGLEREWRFREAHTGGRAGLRTFGLIGLLGGLSQMLALAVGPWLVPVALLGLVALLLNARPSVRPDAIHPDVTTDVAAMVTLLLGAWAVSGQTLFATGVAVVVAVLLNLKPTLQRWVDRLTETEVHAILRFLVISLVILPVIPDRGFGPYAALNPYLIWWTVILISGLSFSGYIAVRLIGPQAGHLLTGLLGGMVSSTVVTANFSRLARQHPEQVAILAAGVTLACSVMALRVYGVAAVLAPALGTRLAWPMGLMVLTGLAMTALLWRRQRSPHGHATAQLENPFELIGALRFAVLFAAILLLSRAAQAQFGDSGLYAIAFSAGLADVDAITITAARQAGASGELMPAVVAIVLAVGANSLVKAGLAFRLGGAEMGKPTAAALGLMLLASLTGIGLVVSA